MSDSATITTRVTANTETGLYYVPTTWSTTSTSSVYPYTLYSIADISCTGGTQERDKGRDITPLLSVADVKLITDAEDIVRAIKVMFADGDVQKAVCSECDEFNLDTGYLVCLAKHLCHLLKSKTPSKDVNKGVRMIAKAYDGKLAKQLAEEDKKARIEYRRAKRAEKKARRKERREQEEREKAIDIQAEAYFRAMKMLSESKGGDAR